MSAERPEEPDGNLDVNAAFAEIVARWEPSDESTWAEPADPEPSASSDEPSGPADTAGLQRLFRPAWEQGAAGGSAADDADARREDDEGDHFVPPPPPPLPRIEPRRKIAWSAVLGAPVVALLLVVTRVTLPPMLAGALALAFVGGFGYLVATMKSSPPDVWSGDDGAVL